MPVQKEPLDKGELENLSLFRGVELQSVLGLLEDCPVRRLKAGEVVIHGGQHNRSVYLLLSGKLRVHLKLTLDPIAILGPGEVVGELSVIDGQPTTAYVVAEEDCRLLVLNAKTLWSLVEGSSVVGRNLLFILAQRLRHGDSRLLKTQESGEGYATYAILDAVTGLHNRRWFDYMLPKQMERCTEGRLELSLLLVAMDHFKQYSEENGSIAGERALYIVASVLRANIPPGHLVARYGGEEFMALLQGTGAQDTQTVGERLRETVEQTKITNLDGQPLSAITISVGVAQMTPGDTPQLLIDGATSALQEAKAEGGNRVSLAGRSI